MPSKFQHLKEGDAPDPRGIWNWARSLVESLNKLHRVWELADMDLTGKAGHTVRVRADESGFEITP